MPVQPGTKQTEDQIQPNQPYDIEQFDCSKLNGTFLITQISKRNTLERIKCHYQYHHGNIVRMIRITQQRRDWIQKQETQHHENQGKSANKDLRVSIHQYRNFRCLIGKTEKTGFHTKGQENQNQCRISIYIRYDSIFTG